jgi:NAD-dependent dihydropyrimidine dehydrogenase PreA subunit
MTYVITDACTKDLECVKVCPVDCIHPKDDETEFAEAAQLYIDPEACIDCGACVPVCPTTAIHPADELPEDKASFAKVNADWFANRG